MATTKNLNVKIDADLKERAEIVFSELGLPTSTAITIFLKTVVRCGGIPFDVRLSPEYQRTLVAIEDVKHHKNLSKTYDTVDELMEEVNVPPPIEAEASCFSENSTTNSEELWRLTLSPQA